MTVERTTMGTRPWTGQQAYGVAPALLSGTRAAPVDVPGAARHPLERVAVAASLRANTDCSRAAMCFQAYAAAVIAWSLTYLIRQPGAAATTLSAPLSPVGNFALEGMLLALFWLGLFAAAALAVLTGAATVDDPSA